MNKKLVIKELEKEGYKLGCWDSEINKLNNTNLKKVLDNISFESDTKVFLNRKPYIVQIDNVEGEIDFNMIILEEYEDSFGEWED